jgi:hypothetical protein
MTKARLLALPLTLALALGGQSVALAAYENETAVTINIPTENIRPGGWSQEHIRDYLRSGGTFRLESVAEPGTSAVDETWGNLSEVEKNDLIEAGAAAGLLDELRTEEEGEPDVDIDIGDDEEESE